MIHIAAITDADLKTLVAQCRENAERAIHIVQSPAQASGGVKHIDGLSSQADHFAAVQNGWADIYQELLDRRGTLA